MRSPATVSTRSAGPGNGCPAYRPPGQASAGWPASTGPERAGEASVEAAAVAAYQAIVAIGKPLSERKLAAKFGKTSRRWARHRMAEARQAGSGDSGRPGYSEPAARPTVPSGPGRRSQCLDVGRDEKTPLCRQAFTGFRFVRLIGSLVA
jgi:hypothetical protein